MAFYKHILDYQVSSGSQETADSFFFAIDRKITRILDEEAMVKSLLTIIRPYQTKIESTSLVSCSIPSVTFDSKFPVFLNH